MSTIEIRVPTLGENITEGTIGKWFKQAGDAVKDDEPLVEVETDKVILEIISPATGILEIMAQTGETAGIGALLGVLRASESSASTTRSSVREIRVPDIGKDFRDVPICDICVRSGQVVAKEETIVTLESDKATMDVPAPEAGVIREIKVKVGDKVNGGSLLVTYILASELNSSNYPTPSLEDNLANLRIIDRLMDG